MLELFPYFLVLSATMFGASNLHSLRTPACIPADAKMEFPGGPAVGCQRPAYLNRLLSTLLLFLYHLSRRWIGMEILLLLSLPWDPLLLRPRLKCTTINFSHSLLQSTYITLSLLGHWLLPIFTPQLCVMPQDIVRLMFDTNQAVTL